MHQSPTRLQASSTTASIEAAACRRHEGDVGDPELVRLRRHEVAVHQIRCRPCVLVAPPALDDGAGFGQSGEDLFVQAFVAQAPAETLDGAVLLRLGRRDVMPVDAGAVCPLQDGAAGHLGPVVAGDRRRLAAPGDQVVQLARKPPPADRGVHHQGQGFAGEVVDDAQDPEAAAPRQGVDQPAGPPLGEAALGHQAEHGLPARRGPGQSFPEGLSGQRRPASTPPAASSAAGSRPQASSASTPRTPASRHTWPSTGRRSIR